MPTTKPRLNVCLDGRTYAAVKSLADASGASMSSIVAEHMDAVAPVLERTAQLLALGKRAQDERLEVVKRIAEKAEFALEPLAVGASSVLDSTWADLERELNMPRTSPPVGKSAHEAGAVPAPVESLLKPGRAPVASRRGAQGPDGLPGERQGRRGTGEAAMGPSGGSKGTGDPRASNYGGQVPPRGGRKGGNGRGRS